MSKKARAAKASPDPVAGKVEGPQVTDRPETPEKYEVEDAARTLTRAEEIKADKRLMPHVHKHIGKQMKSLKELKKLANEKKMEESEEGEC